MTGRGDMPGRGSDHSKRAIAIMSSSGSRAPNALKTAFSWGEGSLLAMAARLTKAPQRRQASRAAPARIAK